MYRIPMDEITFTVPSKEKMSNGFEVGYKVEWIWLIKLEKLIFCPVMKVPSSQIESDNSAIKLIIFSQIQKDEFIQAMKIIHLKIN